MTWLNVYKKFTYIETYDWELRTTSADLESVAKLLKEEKFLNLWNELINTSNIKRVYMKELSDVDKVIYSIDDKNLRDRIKADVENRRREWKRINVEVVQNLLTKYQ